MNLDLVIGCPIRGRSYLVPYWFAATELACHELGLEPAYAFCGDPRDSVFEEIGIQCDHYHRILHTVWCEEAEDDIGNDVRNWNLIRYERMAYLRNQLLDRIRLVEPDVFLSLDSDILLNVRSFAGMLENLTRFDAIGGKTYMTLNGKSAPSYGIMRRNSMKRPDHDGVIKVDVIMAVKLMTPAAYSVDYSPHKLGEDIGWSLNCKEIGLRLGWDGRNASKHVMEERALLVKDPRCGY